MQSSIKFRPSIWGVLLLLGSASGASHAQVYKCPDNLYTDTITPKEATSKGCKALEGAPITVIQGPPRRPAAAATATPTNGSAARPSDSRIDPNDQRARDTDKRRILEGELRREEDRLQALRHEYNGGQPERRGDEKNYQKYIDRVSEMKASVDRSEADVAALKREIGKLTAAN